MSDYDSFAADYDVWSSDMTEDVAWYVELAREAEEPIVELAVGSGRVAIPIARETGKRVIGIDLSKAMLALARERAQGLPLELREGDMRDLELEEPVDLVICPFRSLLHLPTWQDQRRVFERVAPGAAARRAVRLERVRLQSVHRRRPCTTGGSSTRTAAGRSTATSPPTAGSS